LSSSPWYSLQRQSPLLADFVVLRSRAEQIQFKPESRRTAGIQPNRTPILAFLRHTTRQARSADSISRTSVKVSGTWDRFAPSMDAPVADRLRTVQVSLFLPKLRLAALNTCVAWLVGFQG